MADIYFYYIILGGFVGLSSSMLGVGGGVLIVPLLPMIAPISQRETIATSMLTILFVVLVNSWSFSKKKMINWKLVLWLGPFTAIGAFVAGKSTVYLSEFYLKLFLCGIILSLAAKVLIKKTTKTQKSKKELNLTKILLCSFLGLLIGAISGMSGIGAGVLLASVFLHYQIMSHERVVPTANAVMIFTSLFGALSYIDHWNQFYGFRWGLIHGDISLILVCSAWCSSVFGRRIQHNIQEKWRTRILGFLLLGLGLKVLIQTI